MISHDMRGEVVHHGKKIKCVKFVTHCVTLKSTPFVFVCYPRCVTVCSLKPKSLIINANLHPWIPMLLIIQTKMQQQLSDL